MSFNSNNSIEFSDEKKSLSPESASSSSLSSPSQSPDSFDAPLSASINKHYNDINNHLHWSSAPSERRGLGSLVTKANHIAIIVSDIGRSLFFYTQILGLEQIRRPNFDRHGAWMTMGNIELHLIKGKPIVHSGDDLIVGHLSLEVDSANMPLVLDKLIDLGVPFRQNISVPDAKKSRESKFEGAGEGQMESGYYIELCNCDVLTAFSLGQEELTTIECTDHIRGSSGASDVSNGSMRSRGSSDGHSTATMHKVRELMAHWKAKATRLSRARTLADSLAAVDPSVAPDRLKLSNLLQRRNTYGDATQCFSDGELSSALSHAGNDVPLAIRYLTSVRGDAKMVQPPAFMEDGKLTMPKAVMISMKQVVEKVMSDEKEQEQVQTRTTIIAPTIIAAAGVQ